MTALLKQLTEEYLEHRDPERAVPMAAYMRDQFPFLGIPTPERRAIDRGVTARTPPPSESQLANFANACWHRKEREFQYFACDYVARHVRRCSARFLDTACVLICTKSWWDTIDTLAQNTVGTLVREHPELTATMDEWIDEDNFWLVRTAILHQNRWKDATDPDRLFAYCVRQAASNEFFVRKAIGWALHEYSKTDAQAVRRFVKTHERELSGLSRTEALKWLARRRA